MPWDRRIEEYSQKEYSTQLILLTTTSVHLSSNIKALKSAKEMWDAVKKDATSKSDMHKVNTHRRLQSTMCNETGNVQKHHAKLLKIRDELVGMGMKVEDVEFTPIVLGSMPPSYHTFLATITHSAHLSRNAVSPDALYRDFLKG
jgi:hypothetical protein